MGFALEIAAWQSLHALACCKALGAAFAKYTHAAFNSRTRMTHASLAHV